MSTSAPRFALVPFVILLCTPLAGYGQTLTVTATTTPLALTVTAAAGATPQPALTSEQTITPISASLSNPPSLVGTPEFVWSIAAVSGPDGTNAATANGYYAYFEDANAAFDNPTVAATNFRATLYQGGSWQFNLRVAVWGTETQGYTRQPVGGLADCAVNAVVLDLNGAMPTEDPSPTGLPDGVTLTTTDSVPSASSGSASSLPSAGPPAAAQPGDDPSAAVGALPQPQPAATAPAAKPAPKPSSNEHPLVTDIKKQMKSHFAAADIALVVRYVYTLKTVKQREQSPEGLSQPVAG